MNSLLCRSPQFITDFNCPQHYHCTHHHHITPLHLPWNCLKSGRARTRTHFPSPSRCTKSAEAPVPVQEDKRSGAFGRASSSSRSARFQISTHIRMKFIPDKPSWIFEMFSPFHSIPDRLCPTLSTFRAPSVCVDRPSLYGNIVQNCALAHLRRCPKKRTIPCTPAPSAALRSPSSVSPTEASFSHPDTGDA